MLQNSAHRQPGGRFAFQEVRSMAGRSPKTPTKMIDARDRAAFIANLKECGMVGASADALGISRWAFHRARDRHPAFAAEWDRITGTRRRSDAVDAAALELALFKRLLRGVKRRVLFQGKVVDTTRVFDNRLALMMLAKLLPDTYGPDAFGGPEPVEAMSREAFLEAIRPRPPLDDAALLEDDRPTIG